MRTHFTQWVPCAVEVRHMPVWYLDIVNRPWKLDGMLNNGYKTCY